MRTILRYILWVACATVWAMACFILPDFLDNPVHDFRTAVTILGYILALGGASFFVLYLAGLNRYIAAVFYPFFGILGAVVSYFRVAFHATITPMVIDATLHTNGGTISGVVGWQLILWVIANVIIVAGLLFWRWRLSVSKTWLHAIIIICLWTPYYFGRGRLHMSINQRYPYNVVSSLVEYTKQQLVLSQDRAALEMQPQALPDSLDIIFVLGEAMRADHLSLNGYERQTCPRLSNRANVVCLPNIYSPYTYTSLSVPYIMSPADSLHTDWSASYHSFIYTLEQYDFRTSWISNQDNGKTYVAFIHETDTVIFPNASKTSFVFDPWYDEQLLPPLDTLMRSADARNLYVLHTIGSHWYYSNHVPPEYQQFQPLTTNRVITSNTPEEVCNAYDNTALYLDAFLDSLILRFESRCAVMIYLSDHGESLGENGRWLHASESEPLHQPACVVWYSDQYEQLFPEKVKALQANKDVRYGTDLLFYSILSAASIEAVEPNTSQNIFALP
ncbi:MAG: lipid A phosphoethanolamine transferase [Paludibacteraceae bacterium]|nr:lipid A phosphoethanolamine transferase [Paludibacteraceae bacterium]